ncbi:glycosyltransferase [Actinomyces urogenitalis]|nr:glycosyltransferase [Actinomyces urogenitalis]MDU0864987.1 glycosyltransferase [Actinomyces urogenitalis]MDU0874134.1 glycosyltransferase [Actinomyces urogenitalis]MDU1563836.1 glycosyltransferase [Actinomyces urogenitalis]MDU1639203.1 glycosyltransferase [Actinomyces urogenitalis]MDU6152505.1 glycosyltransferase [Actinomyces urogenitalis]
MRSIDVAPLPLSDLESHLDEVAIRRLHDGVAAAHGLLDGRTVWTVTPSAAAEAGPAQTVAPLVGYARGLGIDARWLTLDAPAEFLAVTARLNAALHGSHGDGGKLADKQRDLYEHVLASNAENVVEDVREGDVVILHDPATAGLSRAFSQAGATVIWRCHVGATDAGEEGQRAWAFLDRYLEDADLLVASRAEYLPPYAEEERCAVVAPSINPDSPKNRVLDMDEAASVVRLTGFFDGQPPFDAVPFIREDGRPDAFRGLGDDAPSAPAAGTPVPEGTRVVTQVQRWDPLKGGLELVEAFASQIETLPSDAHLVLAGPTPDPAREPGAARTLEEITERVSTLPESVACRIHVLAIPASDREVNATIVNALQRVSAVVTQRSRVEAFGLTVAEAMWKKAAVVGSAVGGIQDQIEDGVSGVLVAADDAAGWAEAVRDLLLLSERAREMGEVAHEAVRRDYLPDRHLIEVLNVIAQAAV